MIGLLRDVYESYLGDSEPHRLRLAVIFIIAFMVALFGVDLADKGLPAMALTISILAGFTFTSLFSSHALASYDLPKPQNESDRKDLETLRSLGKHFRIRSKLFIILAVIDLTIIIYLSISLSLGSGEYFLNNYIIINEWWELTRFIFEIFSLIFDGIFKFLVIVIFLECLYTFYRLSETIIAVVDIRREYVESRESL